MTNPDWAKVEQWATVDIDPSAACILELRARVEALERVHSIREIAAWLREHGHCEAADELEAAT